MFFSNAFSAWHLADVQILAALRIQDMVESMLRFSGGWVAEVPIPDIPDMACRITCPGLSWPVAGKLQDRVPGNSKYWS